MMDLTDTGLPDGATSSSASASSSNSSCSSASCSPSSASQTNLLSTTTTYLSRDDDDDHHLRHIINCTDQSDRSTEDDRINVAPFQVPYFYNLNDFVCNNNNECWTLDNDDVTSIHSDLLSTVGSMAYENAVDNCCTSAHQLSDSIRDELEKRVEIWQQQEADGSGDEAFVRDLFDLFYLKNYKGKTILYIVTRLPLLHLFEHSMDPYFSSHNRK
jgi:hypothetical protein